MTHAFARSNGGFCGSPGGGPFPAAADRRGFWPADGEGRRAALAIVGFGGVAVVLFPTSGLCPMADPGVFTPAMLAFFVALFTWIGLGAAPRGSRARGLA
ncbi:MAG: hypothetical protein JKP98_08315 [Rhodobacteraceae bacterium]|nr:hypothetical protein [Paracoccaceae bacterium]